MLFSQRLGKTSIKTDLLIDDLSPELTNALWSAFLEYVFYNLRDSSSSLNLTDFCKVLWVEFFKKPVDDMPHYVNQVMVVNKDLAYKNIHIWWHYSDEVLWHNRLDFIEFCIKSLEDNYNFVAKCNYFLKKEMSAYRIVCNEVVQITSEEEVVEIEQALYIGDKFSSARTHLRTALKLLSDKKNPDFRNSMKESISAVEALCKIITGDKSATLGDALKVLEKKYLLQGSLKSAYSALYGYTCDSGGIRHSLKDDVSDLKFEDAKFMLVICSAFVNYLITKMA